MEWGFLITVVYTAVRFFAYPEFGTAMQRGVTPHPGFTAWSILRNLDIGPRYARRGTAGNPILAAIDQAATDTAKRMAQGDYR